MGSLISQSRSWNESYGCVVKEILAILGSLGGVAAFITAIYVIIKAAFGQVNATKENTKALNRVSDTIDKLDKRVDQHDIDIAVIKDRLVTQ
jgi:hypothetical protein